MPPCPTWCARGGGARDLEVRDLGEGWLVVHVLVDCRDAMGANLVNTVAEAVADRVAELAGGRVGLRILSNLSDRRNVRVRCAIPVDALAIRRLPGRRGPRPHREGERVRRAAIPTAPPRTTRGS